MSPTITRSVRQGLLFPEGPRWHDGRLWLSDQHAHQVVAIGDDAATEVVAEFDDMPSGLGWLPDGTLLVALVRSRQLVRVSGGHVTVYADLSTIGDGFLNDMVVDGTGRAYVGYRDGRYGAGADNPTDLVVGVGLSGKWRIELDDDVHAPNGSVVTPDGHQIIIAETRKHRLSTWTIGPDGSLRDRRLFAQLDPELFPDGICADSEGAVWVATLGPRFVRVAEGGKILDSVEVSGGRAVACALGGEGRQTLFMLITDFSPGYLQTLRTADDDVVSSCRGRVDAASVPVPGVGWP
jgi:sugar lactone lactonase YvrE